MGSRMDRHMGRLTTHVLDTAHGRPAAGVGIELFALGPDGARRRLTASATDADGRCPAPLLEGAAFAAGLYELDFHVGAYFRTLGTPLPEPAFVDRVTLRFGVADATAHWHVPLLVSPWGYTTYRGS